ncbi:transcriptional regulator [Salipaludibacillus neizhouensis]|uniref:Transcriptional regulator n=1 Tax=Salipaludibacillus neizhouensis TaxID=885475 RepID=A0A3A9KBZ6_9BACI|nr:LCP family protein [Salipaludibacillus neizhouensis]RKL68300.1 transcriptional regulator [Salipaludibacillus neizhouensis]
MAQSRVNKRKKPRNKFLRVTLITFLALFILVGGALAYGIYKISGVTSSAQLDLERGDMSEYRDAAVDPIEDPVSILFLGLDSRDGDLSGRTDAMVLATFNPEEETIEMVNIPRDSYVEIVGRGTFDKINHAHAFGGLDMTLDTVENMFDIPVDYFVSLNFDAFIEIIDALDGIEVDAPMAITDTDNATYGTISIEEGLQTLNGEEALAYVRMRKQDPRGDLGRGDRQKEVIGSVIQKAASFSSITRFGPLLDSFEGNLNTNISFSSMLGMHSYANELANIESHSLTGQDITENGIYYFQLDDAVLQEVSDSFKVHLGLQEETVENQSTTIQ